MLIRALRQASILGVVLWCSVVWAQEDPAADTPTDPPPKEDDKPPLTGNPQIDYKYDPNLPHELIGYDLSDYPFYPRLPKDLLDPSFNFSCDTRHDGFYASVPHKCQVYHNCLFGQRYDFLCANYTVFDQKNFICHYVSEVDCANSEKYYGRNDELYETTTTTTTTQAPPQIIYVQAPRPLGNRPRPLNLNRPRPLGGFRNGRPNRRPTTTTPQPNFYYDDYYDQYYDQYYDEYYDEYNDYGNVQTTTTTTTTTQRPRRPLRRRPGVRNGPREGGNRDGGSGGSGGSGAPGRFGGVFNVRDRQRPRINPPVPLDAQDDFRPRASRLQDDTPSRTQTLEDANGPRRRRPNTRPQKKPNTSTTTTTTEPALDYYYDDYDYEAEQVSTTTTTTPRPSRRRPSGQRPRGRPEARTTTPAPTTTTTPAPQEAPRRQGGADRVSVRTNPLVNRRVATTEPEVEEFRPDRGPQSDRLQSRGQPVRLQSALRPSFPRRPQPTLVDVVEEEAPLAPGIDVNPEENLSEPPQENPAPSRVRPLRRGPLQDRRSSGPRRPAFDFYDY